MNKRVTTLAILLALVLALLTPAAFAADEVAYDAQALDTNYALALAYIGREDYDKAMEYLDACLQLCDENSAPAVYADVHLKIACVYTIRQEYDKALAELDEALRVDPELSEAYLVKTQVHSDLGEYEEAAAALQKYIDLTGDSSLYEVKAEIYSAVGNADKALESYKVYAEANSESGTEAAYKTAIYDMEQGRYEAAIEEFGHCLNDPTFGHSSYYNTGVCYMRLEDYEKALKNFNDVSNEDFDGLQYNIGVCNMLLDKTEEAIKAFTASIEKESFVTDALYNRAICYVSSQMFAEAIVDFTAYLNAVKSAKVAGLEAELKALKETEGTAQETINAKTEELEAAKTAEIADVGTYYRGVCYLSINDNENAIKDFTVCINAGLAVSDSTFNRGLAYLQSGENELAEADMTASIEAGYNADAATFYRAYAKIGKGDNEGAIADLTTCIEHEYSLKQCYYQRAQIYMAMGDNDKYIADLEASLKY